VLKVGTWLVSDGNGRMYLMWDTVVELRCSEGNYHYDCDHHISTKAPV
jgi:hypothetical protein